LYILLGIYASNATISSSTLVAPNCKLLEFSTENTPPVLLYVATDIEVPYKFLVE
jgi:hypothetical protein